MVISLVAAQVGQLKQVGQLQAAVRLRLQLAVAFMAVALPLSRGAPIV